MINILCTSKPNDGLLYYSYEHMSYLNSLGIEAQLVIISHPSYLSSDYLASIQAKYIHCQNVIFDDYTPADEKTLVMGRSMITHAWKNWDHYTVDQRMTAMLMLQGEVISVYSENHVEEYPIALAYFNPQKVYDLCDTEVYLNGVGDHFEKRIWFDIYKHTEDKPKYKYLINGSNREYYARALEVIDKYDNCAILTYAVDDFHDESQNNVHMPVDNMLGLFETYVYTKNTFDPAPRIIQECQYYGKPYINDRGVDIHDGGSVYMKRTPKTPNIEPILKCL